MRTLSKLALIVDWQYFVDYPEWESVDTADLGNSDAYWDDIKALHQAAGVPLPEANGHLGFWDEFSFSEDSRMYVSDANVMATAYLMRDFQAGDANTPPWDVGVWCFDRHHDAMDGLAKAGIEADNLSWQTFLQSEIGVYNPINVVLPDYLKGRSPAVEHPPATTISEMYYADAKAIMPKAFDFVFVCRSSPHVPTWCDGSFADFVRSCPIPEDRRKIVMKSRG